MDKQKKCLFFEFHLNELVEKKLIYINKDKSNNYHVSLLFLKSLYPQHFGTEKHTIRISTDKIVTIPNTINTIPLNGPNISS